MTDTSSLGPSLFPNSKSALDTICDPLHLYLTVSPNSGLAVSDHVGYSWDVLYGVIQGGVQI